MTATEVLPGLWVGDWQDASWTSVHRPDTLIVTVAFDSRYKGDIVFALVDGPSRHNARTFEEACQYLAQRLLEGPADRPILIHCVSGWSRSVAVILGAWALLGQDPRALFRRIRELRPAANPYTWFVEELGIISEV